MQVYLQGDTRKPTLSRNENTTSEVVSRYFADGTREAKPLKLSTYSDLGLKQKAARRVMMSIRAEMGKGNVLLQGIVEADETYIGEKSRPDYDREDGDGDPLKRGRGTAKDAVLSAIARGGRLSLTS